MRCAFDWCTRNTCIAPVAQTDTHNVMDRRRSSRLLISQNFRSHKKRPTHIHIQHDLEKTARLSVCLQFASDPSCAGNAAVCKYNVDPEEVGFSRAFKAIQSGKQCDDLPTAVAPKINGLDAIEGARDSQIHDNFVYSQNVRAAGRQRHFFSAILSEQSFRTHTRFELILRFKVNKDFSEKGIH